MDKKQFANMVAKPETFTSQERGWLRAMVAKYPHSSVMTTLALLADHAYQFDTPEQRHRVMLAMCDGSRLAYMLEKTKSPVPESNEDFDVLSEINTFHEVSFKTAPKSVILSNFLKAGPSDATQSVAKAPAQKEIDDKKSLRKDESLGTETLAVILEKQGRYDDAIAIYKNLLAQNPEKSSTFAPRIERLETLKNSKQ